LSARGQLVLLIALFIRLSTDGPVILADPYITSEGEVGHRHRFRTMGSGTPAFQAFGGFLRAHSIDKFPAFWDVLRGDLGLGDVLRKP
jgi:lipopolysaccharide/colanic/teichoic acid biosynthesis glycosyltransferase